jgi:hypothetical protein
MNQLNKKNSFEEILKDRQHKDRANEVFLKLLAKQKRPANPFDKVRSQTWNPTDKSNP